MATAKSIVGQLAAGSIDVDAAAQQLRNVSSVAYKPRSIEAQQTDPDPYVPGDNDTGFVIQSAFINDEIDESQYTALIAALTD